MIEPQQVEDGGMEVMNGNRVVGGFESKVIRRPINGPSFDPASGQPDSESVVIMIAAVERRQFRDRSSSKFSAPKNKRVLEKAPLFEIGEERGDRMIPPFGELTMLSLKGLMIVPGLPGAGPDLYETHISLKQPAGE